MKTGEEMDPKADGCRKHLVIDVRTKEEKLFGPTDRDRMN
jgi:hypothetical protein